MVKTDIKEILGKHLGKDPATIEDDVEITSLGADSLDMVEIVLEIEEHFLVAIEEDEYQNAKTVNLVAELVENKLKAKK